MNFFCWIVWISRSTSFFLPSMIKSIDSNMFFMKKKFTLNPKHQKTRRAFQCTQRNTKRGLHMNLFYATCFRNHPTYLCLLLNFLLFSSVIFMTLFSFASTFFLPSFNKVLIKSSKINSHSHIQKCVSLNLVSITSLLGGRWHTSLEILWRYSWSFHWSEF